MTGPPFPPFTPRWPWIGPDLQTLRNRLSPVRADLSRWPAERLMLELADGSGDKLSAALHRPEGSEAHPLLILIHGLTGCEDSLYIRNSAAYFLEEGWQVLRLNLRGAGPSRPYCGELYHAGSGGDIRLAIEALLAHDPALRGAGLFLMGFSLGGVLTMAFLRQGVADMPVLGAACISTPIDLKEAQVRIMAARNRFYHAHLLAWMREGFLAGPKVSQRDREIIGSEVNSVYDFDQNIVAPRNGFRSAEDYYERCSPKRFIEEVTTPLLVIHAGDDPWIPVASYHAVNWSDLAPHVRLALTDAGGHVGFHGAGSVVPWHDRAAAAFFQDLWALR
jgi:predicted alpha/beta-fold hydrolase